MSSELTILALYGFVVMATLLLQVLTSIGQMGLVPLVGNRGDLPAYHGMADRCRRSLENSVVAMALFAPAILILDAQGAFTPSTLLAAQVFLGARIAFSVIYAIGIPWLRTGVWGIGLAANAYLFLIAL